MLQTHPALEPPSRIIQITRADENNLAAINSVVRRAVMNWPMAPRMKRRAVTILQYDRIDMQNYVYYRYSSGRTIMGAIAIDFESGGSDALLHGIYVDPDAQNQGVGATLLRFAERQARCHDQKGMTLKAERVSCGFFERCGYVHQAPITPDDYPYLYRKDLVLT